MGQELKSAALQEQAGLERQEQLQKQLNETLEQLKNSVDGTNGRQQHEETKFRQQKFGLLIICGLLAASLLVGAVAIAQ